MGQTGQIVLQGRSTQIRVVQNGDIALIELVWLWAQLRNVCITHMWDKYVCYRYIHRAYFQ